MIVNCLEFRRTLGADPNHLSDAASAHRAECAQCDQYAREMLRLNGLIERALAIPVPALQASRREANAPRWYAIAASAVLTLTAAFAGIWFLGYSKPSLAVDVIAHMAHEPDAMNPSQTRISNALLDGALHAKGLRLVKPMSDVSYLESCEIRGDFVPHLVVQNRGQPVTVLLLTREKIATSKRFDDRGYHGILVPMTRGAIAVIATDAALAAAVAAQVQDAIGER